MKKKGAGKALLALITAAALVMPNFHVLAADNAKANVISIRTPEELAKIGAEANYPMDGDYVLESDISLSGQEWTPIGGYQGKKGTTDKTQPNVFSGTFDGNGHVISGLKISLDGEISGADIYGQVGFFSVIASSSADDPAEVRNLIFTDVDIRTDFSSGLAAIGTLAGEVNGYATVDNIAVLDGDLIINPSSNCDTVGAGGIIGECRTSDNAIGNGHISATNLYNGAQVRAGGTVANYVYTGGIIGRVAKSAIGRLSQCVNTGVIQYVGYDAYGISGAESQRGEYLAAMQQCYYLDNGAQSMTGTEVALSEKELRGGAALGGEVSAESWTWTDGCYPVPTICLNSSAAGIVYLSGLTLGFAEGEDGSGVKTEISLPSKIGETDISWSSSDSTVLEVSAGKAIAHTDVIGMDTAVTLTATTQEGYSRTFKVTVISSNRQEVSFEQDYAKPGTALRVSVPETMAAEITGYAWTVGGASIANNTDTYTPAESDLEKFISVRVTASDGRYWNLTTYCSELPVVYVDTEDGQGITSNTNTKDAHIRVQGNDEFSDPKYFYDGATTIKGRGNSTWDQAVAWNVKKPYKLKLASKENLLGIGKHGKGKNKHWVLLANMIDHTNMRNEIVNKFSEDIGMEYSMGTTDVVLILNGEYEGVYQLCEHVRVGGARVDVFDWEGFADEVAEAIYTVETSIKPSKLESAMEEDLSWVNTGVVSFGGEDYRVSDYYTEEIPAITGGFLLDMDFRSLYNAYKYISTFQTTRNIPMFFRRPEYAKTNSTMVDFARNYMNAYEAAIGSPDFTTDYQGKTVHYTDLFDLDSLVQYWLICEYTNNWDSMKNSTYVYKDLEGKAKMGPAWDYDWAFGNINMYSVTGPFVWDNWHTTLDGISTSDGGFCEQDYQRNQWNRFLVKDPYFVTKAYEYYQTYRPTVMEDMIKNGGTIDTLKQKYQKASEANDAKWSYSYSKCSGFAFVDGQKVQTQSQEYDAAVASMKTFIEKRTDWFDDQFVSVENLYQSLGGTVSDQIAVKAVVGEDGATELSADVKDARIQYIEFLVNGNVLTAEDGSKWIPVKNQKAVASVAAKLLEAGEGALNTVEAIGADASKNYLSGQMNFTTFATPAGLEPECTHDITEKRNVKKAGCEEKGYTGDTYCTVCNKMLDIGAEVAAKGHAWDAGTVIKEPTVTEEGIRQYTCTVCQKTKTEPIQKLSGAGNVQKVEKITISGISHKLAAGKKVLLTAKAAPNNADNKKLVWSSSNSKYASVSQGGKVTLKKAGAGKSVTITAKSADGGAKAAFRIQIQKHAVKSVSIKNAPKKLRAKKSAVLKTAVKCTGKKANKSLQWSVSDKKYAVVNKKGKVTAKKAGIGKKVTVTVMSTDGSNKKASVKIKIVK